MTELDHKSIDSMPAGRPMDRLILERVLGKNLENYCVLSLHPGDEQCDGCDLPCLLPRCSTDWTEIPNVVSRLNEHGYLLYLNQTSPGQALPGAWEALIVHRETPPASYLWDAGWHAYGQDAPDAVGRAALKWAMERKAK